MGGLSDGLAVYLYVDMEGRGLPLALGLAVGEGHQVRLQATHLIAAATALCGRGVTVHGPIFSVGILPFITVPRF